MDKGTKLNGVMHLPTIVIVSDSHGMEKELIDIKRRHKQDTELFIHCGDSELAYQSEEMDTYYKVRGNCDFDTNYPKEVNITVDNMHFFITHGHLYNVKMNLMPISYRSDEVGANIVCLRHSHVAGGELQGGKVFINPGSIQQPRGGIVGRTPTYVKLSWTSGKKDITIAFLNLNGKMEKEVVVTL